MVGLREVFRQRRGSNGSEMLEVRWASPAWGGGDLGLTTACGVELRLSLVGARGGVMSSHRGWIGGAHWTVGGARTGVRERVELGHN